MAVSVNWKKLKMPNSPTTGERTAASRSTIKEAIRLRDHFAVRRLFVDEFLVEVVGKHGGGGVDLGAERGHHGGDQAGHDDAAHAPGRRKLAQGEGKCLVGVLQRGVLLHHEDPVIHHQPRSRLPTVAGS